MAADIPQEVSPLCPALCRGSGRPQGQRSSEISNLVLHQGGDLLQPVGQLHLLTRTVLVQGHDDLMGTQGE